MWKAACGSYGTSGENVGILWGMAHMTTLPSGGPILLDDQLGMFPIFSGTGWIRIASNPRVAYC